MIKTLKIVLFSFSLALLLSACGGGGGTTTITPAAPPTKVIVKLATVGTPPAGLKIGGLQTEISYVLNKGLLITETGVVASGEALGASLIPNISVSGRVTLGNFTLSGAGFLVGEFATLTFTIDPTNPPIISDFAIVPGSTNVGASDNAATDISSQISVVIQSVTFQ